MAHGGHCCGSRSTPWLSAYPEAAAEGANMIVRSSATVTVRRSTQATAAILFLFLISMMQDAMALMVWLTLQKKCIVLKNRNECNLEICISITLS